MRTLTVAACVLALAVSVSAQPGQVDADPELTALLTEAEQSFPAANDWDRGTAAYQALLAAARAKGSELFEARAILGLGKIAIQQSQYADARRHALAALAIFERLQSLND